MTISHEKPTEYFEKEKNVKEFYERNSKLIEKLLSDYDKHLGEGMTANVCYLESNEELCFKILKNEKDIPYHVSLDQEMEFLRELQDINNDDEDTASAVTVPRPYLAADYSDKENPDGFRFMLMKNLDALSVKDILEGKGSLPEGFSVQSFRDKVSRFIEKMHRKNIYHRDLHAGNIMVDEHGKIYVIDFGASTKPVGDEDPYKEMALIKTGFFTSDEDRLTEVCNLLRNYIKKEHIDK